MRLDKYGKKRSFLLLYRAFSIWKNKNVHLPFSVQMTDTLFTIPQSCFPSIRLERTGMKLFTVASLYIHGRKLLFYYLMALCSQVHLSQHCPIKGDLANSFATLPHIKANFHHEILMRNPTSWIFTLL